MKAMQIAQILTSIGAILVLLPIAVVAVLLLVALASM